LNADTNDRKARRGKPYLGFADPLNSAADTMMCSPVPTAAPSSQWQLPTNGAFGIFAYALSASHYGFKI
jgi:hypothetical protein